MKTYRSRWSETKLFSEKEKNKLYDIVYLYGGYLKYIEEINEGAFIAYYNAKKEDDLPSFINYANRAAKKYFDNIFISATKMRRLIITSNKKVAKSYDWMPEYVNFILTECMKIREVKECITKYIFAGCERCTEIEDKDVYVYNCISELLGFQYLLLNDIKNLHGKKSKGADICLEKVKKNSNVEILIKECPYTNL